MEESLFRFRVGIIGGDANLTSRQKAKLISRIKQLNEIHNEFSEHYKFMDINMICDTCSEKEIFSHISNTYSSKELRILIYPTPKTDVDIDKCYIIHTTSTKEVAISKVIDNSDMVLFISSSESEIPCNSWAKEIPCLEVWKAAAKASSRNRRIQIFLPSGNRMNSYE